MIVNIIGKTLDKANNLELRDGLPITINDRHFELINDRFHEIKEKFIPRVIDFDGERMVTYSAIKLFTGKTFTLDEINSLID